MVKKYINKLYGILLVEWFCVWLLAVVAVVLGEMGVIPNGVVEAHSNEEFLFNSASILLTVIGIPVAVKLFALNITRGLRRMNYEEALGAYHVWSAVRMAILCVLAVFSIVVYYITLNTSGAFCALVILCATLYCLPSKDKIGSFLSTVNND
ncbi:MAG: hypothetical protein J1F40_02780 [Prevotellaceae bacterium]|nr:hypothetical protein [Prevotellaceae bacterium]